MKYKGVIFDQDGTVADHELNYEKAFKIVLARYGVNPSSNFYHSRGIGVEENWEDFIKRFELDTDKTPKVLAVETQEEFKKMLDESKLMPGFMEFVSDLRNKKIKIALATSNTKEIAYKVGKILKIGDIFDAIVTGEEVNLKKPDPEMFLTAARKLKLLPYECFVFEDAASGVIAAHKAGMKVGVILHNNHDHPKFDSAELLIEDFTSIPNGFFD